MSKSKRQRHGHTRSYFGEFDALPLLDWLNRKDRPRNDPIEKLVRLNAAVGDSRALVLGHDAAQEIQATTTALVRRSGLGTAPVVSAVTPSGWEVTWNLAGNMNPSQALAFIRLLHTASQGLLDRVRQCAWSECGKWFFARFSHKECCSGRCQQNRVRSTEEWKKSKRVYMQRLRAAKKQRHKRELELSKSRRKGKTR